MLIDFLCQSYPPHCVVLRLEISEWLWKKSHREQPIVRLAMCERSSLGLPHTQNRMSRRPRVPEILLMRSPQTPRVCGDLKTRPKFVGSVGQFGGKFFANCPKLRGRRRTVAKPPKRRFRRRATPSGTTLSWQCSHSTTNAISELLLFCVCVCVMRYIFISVLFSLGVRGVCVRCGYEDRIHLGRILEEL